MFYWIFGALALLVRLVFAPYTSFGIDESYIIDRLSWGGEFPLTNGIEVYKNSLRPGILMNVLLGLPLGPTQDKSFWAVMLMAVFGWVSALMTFKIFSDFYKIEKLKKFLFIFILFAPWPIIFNSLWHASFTPLSGLIFLISLKTLLNPKSKFQGWGNSGILASFILCFQIGLYFLPLLTSYGILLFFKKIPAPKFKDFLFPIALAAATLLPFYAQGPNIKPVDPNHPRLVQTQTSIHPHTLLERQSRDQKNNQNYSSLVSFHPENLFQLPKVIYRFLSFATFETSRFLGPGTKSTWTNLFSKPWLIPLFLVSWIPSVLLVLWTAYRFYFSKSQYLFVRNRILNRSPSNSTPLSFEDALNVLALILPFVFTGAFLFSLKGPSAHTFWLIWPLSFYPFFKVWSSNLETLFDSAKSSKIFGIWGIIFFCGLTSSLLGHALNPRTCTLRDVRTAVETKNPEFACPMGDPEARKRAYEVILREFFDRSQLNVF